MFSLLLGFALSAKICLDPGHGGSDPGAVGFGRRECDDVLRLSREVRTRLQNLGHTVVMSRDSDVYVSLSGRSSWANGQGCKYFVSIHRNAFSSSSAYGYETYAYSTSSSGYTLAKNIHNAVVAAGVTSNRGVKTANYAVLRQTSMASSLCEVLFITNSNDNAYFDSHFSSYAQAIANGISTTAGGSTGGGGSGGSCSFAVGSYVTLSGATLYTDSYAGTAARSISGTYSVSRYISGRAAGVLLQGSIGWVRPEQCSC
ncbi:N-acetylmuramoyl-L-alanine amidase [Histomonas meleagridis]|uniref:N-acetylmuramoyl-L-alanine amidase n=1 Tax=Histomonas meleagridis TaxID=135588 RepID=UPI003559732D|nr:N-acetylmuramoyl-L-alanine amidase [Histomonas meleagridis]KAH0804388.1 N-acetylmuramoyl-L-alanine amidase [Histomonas meleagridis]